MAGLKGRILAGGLWLGGARGVVNALTFISTIVLARLLIPEDFGLVALGTSLMMIVRSLTEMSVAQALIHQRDVEDDHFDTAFTLNVARGLVLALILGLSAKPMAWAYNDTRLESIVYAFAASVVVEGFLNPRQVALVKDMLFRQQFILTIGQNLTSVAVSVAVAIIWRNYWALVAGVVAGQFVMVTLSYALLPYRPKIRWNRASELWQFSMWMTLSNAVNTINWRSDQLLVGGILGRTTLGHYTVGDNLAQTPTRETVNPLQQALFPALAQIAHEPDQLREGYQRAQSLITFAALPVGFGVALIAEPAVLLTMGEKWLPAVPIIQALSAIFALQTLGSMVQPLGMAKGETRRLFNRSLFMFAIRIPLVIGATLTMGLAGLIISRVLSGLIGMFVNLGLVRRLVGLPIREQLLSNWRSLVAVFAMVGAVGTLRVLAMPAAASADWGALWLIIQLAGLGAVTYIGASMLLWLLSKRPEGPEREVIELCRSWFQQARQRTR